MSETAADLVDCVLPEVPLRQWVLSVPFDLRLRLAAEPDALTLVARVFFEELRRWYRDASGLAVTDAQRVEAGAVTFVQRFGGSLNLNVHLHVIAADGAWRCPTDGSSPEFVATPSPRREDLAGVLERVVRRVAKSLAREVDDESEDDEGSDDPLRGCRRAAVARGTYGSVSDDGEPVAEDGDAARFGRRPPKAQAVELAGFNLHASVYLGATDVEGRERLLRYVARPAVALERVSELPDGRIAYRVKWSKADGRGETHRLMTPMEFMARLAALVPPPRHPLVRYHGVFAPNSPWRAMIVPGPRRREPVCDAPGVQREGEVREDAGRVGAAGGGDVDIGSAGAVEVPTTEPTVEGRGATGTRIDWATLLHRVWGVDVLSCPRCGGRMRFIATITDRVVIRRILEHLGLPADEVTTARARSWDWDDTS